MPAPALASKQTKLRAIVQRKDGRELRRLTIYLPCELARTLRLHCAEREQEMSAVVALAVEHFLRSADM